MQIASKFNEEKIRIRDWFRSQRKKDIICNNLKNKVVFSFFMKVTFFQRKKVFQNWENQILSKNFIEKTYPTLREYEEMYYFFVFLSNLFYFKSDSN